MHLVVTQEAILLSNNEVIFQSSTSNIPSEIYHLKEDQINAITSVNKEFIKNKLNWIN